MDMNYDRSEIMQKKGKAKKTIQFIEPKEFF